MPSVCCKASTSCTSRHPCRRGGSQLPITGLSTDEAQHFGCARLGTRSIPEDEVVQTNRASMLFRRECVFYGGRAIFEHNSFSSRRMDWPRAIEEKAWAAIRAGKVVHCCGKAQMIWTEPKPQPSAVE